MSHFTCLVVGADHSALLAPFHEFECTGEDDEYVQDVDVTEERLEEYLNETRTFVIFPDRSRFDKYDERFWKDPREAEKDIFCRKVFVQPEGTTLEELKVCNEMSFLEWLERDPKELVAQDVIDSLGDKGYPERLKYGFVVTRDTWDNEDPQGRVAKVIRRTNPNKHWDWYVIGGRWKGWLKAKEGAQVGHGAPGTFGGGRQDGKPGHCDQARKRDIDFDGMRAVAEAEAAERYDKVHGIVGDLRWKPWDEVREAHDNIEDARKEYNEQEVLVKLREGAGNYIWGVDEFLATREQYLADARRDACIPYAMVVDGEWYEKGQMGWWGMASGEMSDEAWAEEVNKLLDGLGDDELVTVVDCHI